MDIKELEKEYIIDTYGRQPEATLLIERGEGVYVWDDGGRRYLDFVSGLAVNNLGHCHPQVVEAVRRQAGCLMHTSNLYYARQQTLLAERLVQLSCAKKVFFCNSGTETNEAAIKLARKYGKQVKGGDAYEIITAYRSFHGRTLASLTATGQPKYHKGFEPLVPGFRYAHFNDLQSFAEQVTEKTAAILVEPVQGEGGVYPAAPEFLQGLRRLCDEHNLLLIFDEVQCGMGRTGKLFAYEHYGVEPDIFTLAKALGGGLPIGVMAAGEKAADILAPGEHASTFGGNSVVCAAAHAVLDVLTGDGFLEHVAAMNTYRQAAGTVPKPGNTQPGTDDRAEMTKCADCARLCQEEGLLVNCIGGKIPRFCLPGSLRKNMLTLLFAYCKTF